MVKHNTRLPADADLAPMTRFDRLVNRELLGNGAFGLGCAAASRVPALASPLRRAASGLMAGSTFSDASHRVFVAPRRVRFEETEYAMALEAFGSVVREVERAIVDSGEVVTFPLEVRVSGADDTWLDGVRARGGLRGRAPLPPRGLRGPAPRRRAGVRRARRTPHWGKRHTLGASDFERLYPRFPDARGVRERVDPTGLFLNPHLRQVFGLP